MIPDYAVVAWALFIVRALLTYWNVCMICTGIMWLVFAVRIGKVRILRLEDLMPRGGIDE